MGHAYHQKPRRIFGDDCEECVERASTIRGLASLDSTNIRLLGDLASEIQLEYDVGFPPDVSNADIRAVENLRLAARIVFASGITEEVAR